MKEKDQKYRTESDSLGNMPVPANALYGIHALRARSNFPDETTFPVEWYKAVGVVKKACYITYLKFKTAVEIKYPDQSFNFPVIANDTSDAMTEAAGEVSEGMYFDHFIVPAVSGGAGTSINMNVNEIIANAALLKLGFVPGDYSHVHPIESANIFQSTNDVIPTALKIAVMQLLTGLEDSINYLRQSVEALEGKYRNVLRIAYTQMQEAVPSSYGKLFSTYSEALSRDWWRVSKCFERIKVVNLGGSAIGTGMTVPQFFIMEVVPVLQQLTGLPVARGENLPDATNNLDSLVEVHAILKSYAVNLEKMVSDLRLLAADTGHREITLPARQVGSSIMPGKVNPVIPEFVVSASHKVYSNDQLISSLSALGCLDLNAYLPVIGCAIIESIKLLTAAGRTIRENMLEGLTVSKEATTARLFSSPSITTALVAYIGYEKSAQLAKCMKEHLVDVYEANEMLGLVSDRVMKKALKPENLLKTGYSINDVLL
ncbi:MAG TPA: lyase family protein [Bacteroidales bacterium]|nr:lyase family protein [Bacteroidales bacterium]